MYRDDADLTQAIQITMPMLMQVKDKYDFEPLKAYETQDINDVVADLHAQGFVLQQQ